MEPDRTPGGDPAAERTPPRLRAALGEELAPDANATPRRHRQRSDVRAGLPFGNAPVPATMHREHMMHPPQRFAQPSFAGQAAGQPPAFPPANPMMGYNPLPAGALFANPFAAMHPAQHQLAGLHGPVHPHPVANQHMYPTHPGALGTPTAHAVQHWSPGQSLFTQGSGPAGPDGRRLPPLRQPGGPVYPTAPPVPLNDGRPLSEIIDQLHRCRQNPAAGAAASQHSGSSFRGPSNVPPGTAHHPMPPASMHTQPRRILMPGPSNVQPASSRQPSLGAHINSVYDFPVGSAPPQTRTARGPMYTRNTEAREGPQRRPRGLLPPQWREVQQQMEGPFSSLAETTARHPERANARLPSMLADTGQAIHPNTGMDRVVQPPPLHRTMHQPTEPEPVASAGRNAPQHPMQMPGRRTPERMFPQAAPRGLVEGPPEGQVALPLRIRVIPPSAPGGGNHATAAQQAANDEDEIQPGPPGSATPQRKRKREKGSSKSKKKSGSTPSTPAKKKSKSSTKKKKAPAKKIVLKTLPKPHTLFAPAAEGEQVCAFCKIPGAQLAVEGELLGPFDSKTAAKMIYAHRNCLFWAPEVFEDDDGNICGVSQAFKRAKNAVCRICGGKGATLCCQKAGLSCCRPMHFRCAIQKGAKLSNRGGPVKTMCPLHDIHEEDENLGPIPKENLFVQTPAPEALLQSTAVVRCCDTQNYHFSMGTLLHCNKCHVLEHSSCVLPENFDNFYGTWGAMSGEGKYLCKTCANCDMCGQDLSNDVTNQHVKCVHCKHRAVHISCAGGGVKNGEWRCDYCRYCRHCTEYVPDPVDWVEKREACRKCDEAHDNGVICPICTRVYREDLESEMIQCDGCEEWLHLECASLTLEELERLTNPDLDMPYFCQPCTAAGRAVQPAPPPEAKPTSKRKKSQKKTKRESAEPEPAPVIDNVDIGFIDGDVDPASGVGFSFNFGVARRALELWDDGVPKGNAAPAVPAAAPCQEICMLCGSSGSPESFRFCSDCGEAYHGFCVDENLPDRRCGPFIGDKSGSLYRLSAGGPGEDCPAWRCYSCTRCKVCLKDDDGDSEIVLCDHCGRGVHLKCANPPLEETPEGSFKCDECDFCEMCGVKEIDTIIIDEHSFCQACSLIVKNAKKCVVCSETYPKVCAASLNSTPPISITPDVEGGRQMTGTTRGGATTQSPNTELLQVRRELDMFVNVSSTDPVTEPAPSQMEASSPSRRFPTGAKCFTCGSVVHAACDAVVSNNSNYQCPRCRDPNNAEGPAQKVRMEEWSPLSNNNVVGDTATAMEGVTSGTSELEEVDVSQHPNGWSMDECDRRVCTFCQRPEKAEGLHKNDRLIPFRSHPLFPGAAQWVHIGCANFSCHVTRLNTGPRSVVLYGSSQLLFPLRGTPRCTVCNERGGIVLCGHKGCGRLFHLQCGMQSGMGMTSVDDGDGVVEKFYCQEHCAGKPNVTSLSDAYKAMCFSSCYRGGATRPRSVLQRAKITNRTVSKTAQKCLVRVGGLSVMNLGHHVPYCAEFIVGKSMVPINYRATRNYWSLTRKGKRTLYHMEVKGGEFMGPLFSVWTADNPANVFEDRCPGKLWSRIETRLNRRSPGRVKVSLNAGLEKFGLANCDPVVKMIESMPLAWLHENRYTFLFDKPKPINPRSRDFVKNMGILNTMPMLEERSKAARTEGYVATNAKRSNGGPSIPKTHTGELYQLGVIMEREGFPEYAPKVFGMVGTTSKSLASAAERAAGSRRVKKDSKTDRDKKTIVLQSRIAGYGVFAQDDFEAGDVVMEYVGEVIRDVVGDPREIKYESNGIGCYMFGTPDGLVIDATMVGNAARFINHSCGPNCYAKAVKRKDGKFSVFLVAKRAGSRGDELSYDYLFQLEKDSPTDEKLRCMCGAPKCRKWMN